MKNKLIMDELKELLPDVVGFIEVKVSETVAMVVGQLMTTDKDAKSKIEKLVGEHHPGKMFIYSVNVITGLTVVADEELVSTESQKDLDKVKVIYEGYLPISAITSNPKHKVQSDEQLQKLDMAVKVVDFIAPIIVDSNLKVIDGELRLMAAKLNKKEQVSVVVINDSGVRAEYLRLVLNRLGEFQRWDYRDVDNYVDSVPQAQPLLEPFGFFGSKLLPESFFSDSMLNYEIDVFNNQQSQYRQETHIQDWAKLRKAEIQANYEAAQAKKKQKVTPTLSLFDLTPQPEDFIETYNVEEEIEKNVVEMKELAGTITENFDEVRKAEMAEKGLNWQNSRRNTKEVAAEKREDFIDMINKSDLSAREKINIIQKIDDFDSMEQLEDYLKGDE